MIIRKARRGDLKEIFILYKKIFSKSPYKKWPRKNLMDKLQEILKKQKFYVAQINNKIVGFVSFYYLIMGSKGKIGYIEELGVEDRYRSKGIGKILILKAEKELKKIRCKSVLLDVEKKVPAVRFYKKMGYIDVGYIKMGKKLK